MLNNVFSLGTHTNHTNAAAPLTLVHIQTNPLDVAAACQCYHNVIVVNQIFLGKFNIRIFADNFSPARIAKFFFNGGKFSLDNLKNFTFVSKNFVEAVNFQINIAVFIFNFFALKTG